MIKIFSKLREIRKKVATEEGMPAYAVFTDEELAGLAKLETITPKSMLSVKGIGDKKVERFGKQFLNGFRLIYESERLFLKQPQRGVMQKRRATPWK